MDIPTQADFEDLANFLYVCEAAAEAIYRPKNALAKPTTSLLTHGLPYRTFSDLQSHAHPNIAHDEQLPETRSERISTLRKWMARFPAYEWLQKQAPVTAALESFHRIKKRSGMNSRFIDDIASFRFWRCVALAGEFRGITHFPSPNAEQRKSAEKAARRLRQLSDTTRLLTDIGMTWDQRKVFEDSLDMLLSIGTIARKPRADSHTADREYIDLLTLFFWREFDTAPPSLIIALAGLKLSAPDPVPITKMVAAEFKRLAAKGR